MNLVEKIAQKSLEIALPSGASGRGKAKAVRTGLPRSGLGHAQAQKIILRCEKQPSVGNNLQSKVSPS
jgi:hypothetical protein